MSIRHVPAGISLERRPRPPTHDKLENPPPSMESFLWGNALLAGVLLSVMCSTQACGWGAPYKVQSVWPSTLFAAGLSKDSLWAYMGCHERKEEVEEEWEKQFPVCASPCCAAKNVILLYRQCSKAVNCFLLKWAWRIKVCALLVIFRACWALHISNTLKEIWIPAFRFKKKKITKILIKDALMVKIMCQIWTYLVYITCQVIWTCWIFKTWSTLSFHVQTLSLFTHHLTSFPTLAILAFLTNVSTLHPTFLPSWLASRLIPFVLFWIKGQLCLTLF